MGMQEELLSKGTKPLTNSLIYTRHKKGTKNSTLPSNQQCKQFYSLILLLVNKRLRF